MLSSTVVEHLTHYPKMVGLNPATGTRRDRWREREKWQKILQVNFIIRMNGCVESRFLSGLVTELMSCLGS
jgi:hypothetical protein